MTTDLTRRVAALESRTSMARPVREMSDTELISIVGLGDNPSDEQLRQVIEAGQGTQLNKERST